MGNRVFTEREVVELTRNTVKAIALGDLSNLNSVLDTDFEFVTDENGNSVRNRDQFLAECGSFGFPELKISDDTYEVVAHEKGLWITFSSLSASFNDLGLGVHFTTVWRQRSDDLFLLHCSIAHAVSSADAVMSIPQLHSFDGNIPPRMPERPSGERSGYRDLQGNIRYIHDRDILYFESNGKTCVVHAANQEPFETRVTLNSLVRDGFYMIHRGNVVNLQQIKDIKRYTVTLTDGTRLPIGKERYIGLREILGTR